LLKIIFFLSIVTFGATPLLPLAPLRLLWYNVLAACASLLFVQVLPKESKRVAEYLSVAEFAEYAGVSPQAVYKRLPDLGEFVRIENGRKLVDTRAVSQFNVDKSTNHMPNNQPNQPEKDRSSEAKAREIERLMDLIERQQDMLEEAEREKRRLNDNIVELSAKIAQMGENAQYIAAQAQRLQLADKIEPEAETETVPEEQKVDCDSQPTDNNREKTNRLPGWLKWLVNRYEA
jgi:predicted DNA-binding protein YlxM (UPF0122 family)